MQTWKLNTKRKGSKSTWLHTGFHYFILARVAMATPFCTDVALVTVANLIIKHLLMDLYQFLGNNVPSL